MPRVWSQVLNFYKTFSVLHIIGQMSMDKVSRLERRACGRDPPGGGKKFGLLPVACGRGLRTVVHACGRDPPYFLFLLDGWRNTTSPLSLALRRFCPPDERQLAVQAYSLIKATNLATTRLLMFTIRNIFNFWIPASSTI